MKIRDYIIIASSFLLFCSCAKEPEQNGGAGGFGDGIYVRMTASAEDVLTRMNLAGTVFSWEKDDAVRLRWADPTYQNTTDCETLYARESGASALFEGSFSTYKEDANLYAYYSEDGTFVSKTSVAYRAHISSQQTGRLEDVADNVLFYSWIKKATITLKKTGDEVTGMEFSSRMSPFFAIVKINIPASLGYTSLKMEATSAIAGHVQIQPQKTWGSIGSSGLAYRPTGTGLVQGTSVTISDNGNVLGDDVYIVVVPDTYDQEKANYCCSSESLKFTLTGPDGEVSFEKSLNGKIYNGTLKDLGSIPGSMFPLKEARLCLMGDNVLKATVADTLENCEFYYEIGKTEADCPAPTVASTRFYAKDGFEIPVENTCNSHFVKVLARKTLPYISEVVSKAYVRNWTFGKDSPVADAVSRHANLFPNVGDTYHVGGMDLYRTNSNPVGVTMNDDHLVMMTCYLAMNAQVQNDSHGWLYFRVNGNYKRGYKLYNDNATFGTVTYNGKPVTASVEKDAEDPFGQRSFVWDLGEVKKGFQCGVRGDGTHAYYAMAFMETGDNVTSPVKGSIDVALKVTDHEDVPRVVLDSVSLSKSIAQGARYHFLTGSDGFDAMADPTPNDSVLTAQGISIPVQNKTDRMYIKVLGQCEGCDDVCLKAVLRNWKYDINYIAPAALETEYDGLTLTLSKMWSDTTYTDNRIGYMGCQAGNVAITPELEGTGWLNANFFAGSFGTTLWMFNGEEQLYRIDMPAKTYYSENDIMKSVRTGQVSPSQEVICRWSYRIWLRNMIFLEQAPYTPASYGVGGGDASIEDFDGNINYQ